MADGRCRNKLPDMENAKQRSENIQMSAILWVAWTQRNFGIKTVNNSRILSFQSWLLAEEKIGSQELLTRKAEKEPNKNENTGRMNDSDSNNL